LKPRSLLRSRRIASPFGFQLFRAALAARRRRALLLACALGSAFWVLGCQSYNVNLGAPSAQSSQLSLLTPGAKRAGEPAFTLTITGAGFVTGSNVQWNGSNRATEVVSFTEISASISVADIASAGTFQIRVMTPGPNDGNNFSNILTFLVCDGVCPQLAAAEPKAASTALAGDSYSPAISADRRYVAFASVSADPSTNASTGLRKIFLRDTCDGAPAGCEPKTLLVSPAWHGGDPNGDSRSPAISADGRFVAFASDATDLIEKDSNGVSDIFLRDTCINAPEGCTPATTRVSLGPDGVEANGASDSPALSPDARFIAFDSEARNLVPDGSAAPTGAFLRDTCFGAAGECTPGTTRLAISPAPPR
jgi:hypothetical protein